MATAAVPVLQSSMSSKTKRDGIVLDHLPLVKAIAVRLRESLPMHVELDDLVHAGIFGLFDAATRYSPDKKVPFSAYAKYRIKGSMLDSLRQLDWASRDVRRRHKQVESIMRDLSAVLQRVPTEAEVAEKMGLEVREWRRLKIQLPGAGLVSASTRANDVEDQPAPDYPAKPETHPDAMYSREELRTALNTAMQILPVRYRKVVVMYYRNEMTMKEIGGRLGVNESRVSQIHASALEKMATTLQSSGINSSAAFAVAP